jgi:hypothetical protein
MWFLHYVSDILIEKAVPRIFLVMLQPTFMSLYEYFSDRLSMFFFVQWLQSVVKLVTDVLGFRVHIRSFVVYIEITIAVGFPVALS